jgi:hypothetical protein
MMAVESVDAVAKSCLRLDSPEPDARWADQRFPMVLAIDSGSAGGQRSASVLTVGGQPTQLRATWRPRGDSVSVTLRRIGYSGSIVLGPDEGARSGLAVSSAAPAEVQNEMLAQAPSAQSRARADGAREEASRKAAAAAPRTAPSPGPPVRQLRVTARAVPCPG